MIRILYLEDDVTLSSTITEFLEDQDFEIVNVYNGHKALDRLYEESFDLLIVAPATANILGKAAHAVADDLLSTLLSIMDCPVLFVPAMNHRMWNNPATQEAVAKLRGWGRRVMEPDTGELATRHVGVGRFPETARIMEEIRELLEIPQLYSGRRVLITAGPTREPLDPVRYISNRSSGRMGFALASAALDMGADVTVISGPVTLDKGTLLFSFQHLLGNSCATTNGHAK